MKTILLTAIGGDLAQSTAKILKEERPDIRLIGMDMSTEHAGEYYVDKVYKVPSALSKDYKKEVGQIIKNAKVDLIIPLSEKELSLFYT